MLRTIAVLAGCLLLIAALLFAPIEVPDTLTMPGRVQSLRDWTLVRNQNESVASMVRDHLRGTVESYDVNRFERGDAIRITLHPRALRERMAVGDTVAVITSSETQQRLTALAGELDATRAALDAIAAGEKSAVVETERSLLTQAQERVRQQQVSLERLRQLHARGLIADQELELAESEQRVLVADVAVAEARVEAAFTGAKPLQLDVLRAEMEALQQEINALRRRQQRFTITAPLDGHTMRATGPDTLLTVRDDTAVLITMPVSWADHARLSLGQPLDVTGPGLDEPLTATIARLGDEVHSIGSAQVLLVAALAENAPASLLPGTRVTATASFEAIPLRVAAWDLMQDMFNIQRER